MQERPEQPDSGGKPAGDQVARCVLWSRQAPPSALLEAMSRRGVTPTLTHDAFRAMAEVVVGGSLELTGAILVLVEPSELRGKREMLTSCRRYAPGLRVWVFQARAPVKLRPLALSQLVPEPEDQPDEGQLGGSSYDAHSLTGSLAGVKLGSPLGPGHSLRLVNSDGAASAKSLAGSSADSGTGDPDNRGGGTPGGLLTDEELAMLLADDHPGTKSR